MDFKPFEGKSDDGAVMTVTHPGTAALTDAKITLAGEDSKLWRKAGREVNMRSLQGTGKKLENIFQQAAERIEKNKPDLLASVTLSWVNVELNGKKLECTRENARKLYESHPWLLEQVNTFVGNRANFFRPVDAPAPEGDQGARAIVVATEE